MCVCVWTRQTNIWPGIIVILCLFYKCVITSFLKYLDFCASISRFKLLQFIFVQNSNNKK